MEITGIFTYLTNALKARSMDRDIKVPGGREGRIILDAEGNETILIEKDRITTVRYDAARATDVVRFVKCVQARYGAERVKTFREIIVGVDDEDIPKTVSLCDRLDDPYLDDASITFALKPHRDFTRWMTAKNLTQTQFRNLVLELAEQHDQPDLGGQLQILNYKVEINFDAAVETERDMVLAFSAKETEGTFQIPKRINVTCPVVSGAEFTAQITFEVVIVRPSNPSDKIKFTLEPYGIDRSRLLQEAYGVVVEQEVIAPLQAELAKVTEIVAPIYTREMPKSITTTILNDSFVKLKP